MLTFKDLLDMSSARHDHLCPRQVLGVRTGMLAGEFLGLELPQNEKRLFTFMETDGCMMDGVSVSTGCWLGHRTMRMMDFGKMASTFVDTYTDKVIRISPHPEVRQFVEQYAHQVEDQWHAYLLAYQSMPQDKLLVIQSVKLTISLNKIISREDAKSCCGQCGEEIFNEREVLAHGQILCESCAGHSYYDPFGIGEEH